MSLSWNSSVEGWIGGGEEWGHFREETCKVFPDWNGSAGLQPAKTQAFFEDRRAASNSGSQFFLGFAHFEPRSLLVVRRSLFVVITELELLRVNRH